MVEARLAAKAPAASLRTEGRGQRLIYALAAGLGLAGLTVDAVTKLTLPSVPHYAGPMGWHGFLLLAPFLLWRWTTIPAALVAAGLLGNFVSSQDGAVANPFLSDPTDGFGWTGILFPTDNGPVRFNVADLLITWGGYAVVAMVLVWAGMIVFQGARRS